MRLRVPGCPAAVSPAEQEGEGRDADADLIGVCPAGALAGLPAASPASRRSQSRLIARLARSAMPGTGSCPGDGAAWRHSSTAGPWCRQRARKPLTAEIASCHLPVARPPARRSAPATASGSPTLTIPSWLVRRGPPHSREPGAGAHVGGEGRPAIAQMGAGQPQQLPDSSLPALVRVASSGLFASGLMGQAQKGGHVAHRDGRCARAQSLPEPPGGQLSQIIHGRHRQAGSGSAGVIYPCRSHAAGRGSGVQQQPPPFRLADGQHGPYRAAARQRIVAILNLTAADACPGIDRAHALRQGEPLGSAPRSREIITIRHGHGSFHDASHSRHDGAAGDAQDLALPDSRTSAHNSSRARCVSPGTAV